MDWLKTLLPVVQTGLRMYLGGQLIKKTSDNAKTIALRSSILGFGILSMLVLLLAALVMTFVDLGSQFESHDGVHFSGMMMSSLCLVAIGVFVFLVCLMVNKFLAAREKEKRELEKVPEPTQPILIFVEQFLEALLKNLSEKPNSNPPSSPN